MLVGSAFVLLCDSDERAVWGFGRASVNVALLGAVCTPISRCIRFHREYIHACGNVWNPSSLSPM